MDELAKIASNLESQSLWNRAVSSDTKDKQMSNREEKVSIPLEQGSVFRLNMDMVITSQFVSQSLWNRAVSSDNEYKLHRRKRRSQSLWNRAVSSDQEIS